MIRGIVASVIAAGICALLGWAWFAFFSEAFFSNPLAFVLFSAISLATGLAIGSIIGWNVRKNRDEATKSEETARKLEETEREFRNMSFRAKALCFAPAKEGVREISGEDDLNMDFDDPDWVEAENAGFILIEECGRHQHRIHATNKLALLIDSKPGFLDELSNDIGRDLTENIRFTQRFNKDRELVSQKVVDRITGEEIGEWHASGKGRIKTIRVK